MVVEPGISNSSRSSNCNLHPSNRSEIAAEGTPPLQKLLFLQGGNHMMQHTNLIKVMEYAKTHSDRGTEKIPCVIARVRDWKK